ncbi:S1-C subfamily serine protease [Deinobacterium chartae]|uniref:S1-C subfamily serine protease n=1 Tax=Deinobacterium chartae TaxID=521158 RepID=A0A841I4L2_9DEIO|nr:trypsin-like peptidase domain-containing protein [Deinobacterium chartae]MBB6098825.1 S1-C subfamily serine protease [Deinobacterium chartae]
MKRNLTLIVTGALIFGAGFVVRSIGEVEAQSAPAVQTAQVPAPTALDPVRAGLENERNTESIVQRFESGVVFVNTTRQTRNLFREDFSGLPFALPEGTGSPQVQRGSGSGFFIDASGLVLTNHHVIEGADRITVKLQGDDRDYSATVVGSAADYDLALLKVEGLGKAVQPLKLANSDSIRVGQKAIAMGAPFGLDFSVTEGIVSAIGREIPVGNKNIPQKVIQTDAAINPGNSGGPLLNSAGEVIGINSQILSPSGALTGEGQFAGVGFAIPSNVAAELLPRLKAGEKIETPTLGIRFSSLEAYNPEVLKELGLPEQGMLVVDVTPGSPADKAGLRGGQGSRRFQDGTLRTGGDVILSVDGQRLTDSAQLPETLLGKRYGDTLRLGILRDGREQTVTVRLERFEAAQ